MTQAMTEHTIDTPAGTFVIYMGSAAANTESHKPLRWYYAPVGWEGEPFSKDYYSPESAEEACWEHVRAKVGE